MARRSRFPRSSGKSPDSRIGPIASWKTARRQRPLDGRRPATMWTLNSTGKYHPGKNRFKLHGRTLTSFRVRPRNRQVANARESRQGATTAVNVYSNQRGGELLFRGSRSLALAEKRVETPQPPRGFTRRARFDNSHRLRDGVKRHGPSPPRRRREIVLAESPECTRGGFRAWDGC